MCRQVEKQGKSQYCSRTCTSDATKQSPGILEVPAGHETFESVANQFKASWKHTGKTLPTVKKVYKVLVTQASMDKYEAYRTSVEAQGQFVAINKTAGNENRRWHGTRRECLVGDAGQTSLCATTSCSLCNILRTSYDLSLFGKKTGWGRFGSGIYTSATSSKSDDYITTRASSQWKAMLLNKVVVGNGYKLTQDNSSLTAPPQGYHSVLGETGGSLNHDELIVYTNDAIRASFLVMYGP